MQPELEDETLVAPASAGIPSDFLEACFASGMLASIDAISIHPYRRTYPETVIAVGDHALSRVVPRCHVLQSLSCAVVTCCYAFCFVTRGISPFYGCLMKSSLPLC